MADADDPFSFMTEMEHWVERLKPRGDWTLSEAFRLAMLGKELDMTDERGRREYALQRAIDVVKVDGYLASDQMDRVLKVASRFEAWLRSGEIVCDTPSPPRGEYLDVGDRLERFITDVDVRFGETHKRIDTHYRKMPELRAKVEMFINETDKRLTALERGVAA